MKRYGYIVVFWIIGLSFLLSSALTAEESISLLLGENISLTVGTIFGTVRGNTTYEISDSDATSSFKSRLEFPLNNALVGIEINLLNRRKPTDKYPRGCLTIQWLSSDTTAAGKMQDSDWLSDDLDIAEVGSAHAGRDIYSKSDADLSASIVHLVGRLNFTPEENLTAGIILGYYYQYFDYDISNVNQVGLGPYAPSYTGSVSGLVSTYQVSYDLPYFGLGLDGRLTDSFNFSGTLGYSPWASATDIDDHILRNKKAKGNCRGDTFLINLKAEYQLQSQWSLQLAGSYININTEGTQSQYWYGDDPVSAGDDTGSYISGIPDEITSIQTMFLLTLIYRF